MEDYKGKVVVVTGACGGIGSVIARMFAQAGASLGICDIRQEKLDQLAGDLERSRTQVYSAPVDVTDQKHVHKFCEEAARSLGGIDYLVNTVGIVDNMGDVEDLSLETWNSTLAVNLSSAFLLAKFSVPHMKTKGGGAIVNISSVSGMANQLGVMVYSVTKAGMISLTKSEAIDLARYNIRANSICPASVETPMLHEAAGLVGKETGRTPEEQWQYWASQYPTQRFTKPKEIAELALFLCSDRAANITGASFVIDGGLTALLPER